MVVDSLLSPWLILFPSIVVGAFFGVVFERTRGTAARRAAKFEADLVEARSQLMRYREQTKHHFGKSAELLGRMATDYREFLDHFVDGAEALCGPNMKEINASGLDRRMLGTPAAASEPIAASGGSVATRSASPAPGMVATPSSATVMAAPAPAMVAAPSAVTAPVPTPVPVRTATVAPTPSAQRSNGEAAAPIVSPVVRANGGAAGVPITPPPVRTPLATEPFAEAK
jgi:uncharacterized membrane-anchored protein YhcB (DUF1043 family)